MNNIKLESELLRKISFWRNKLDSCKDPVESAILADKISETRKKLAEIRSEKSEKKISTQIDAPAMIDRVEQDEHGLNHSQIVNTDNSFGIII